MSRPENLKTKIFLDSGDPEETRQVLEFLGFLDGQTTNPTLISKNPQAKKRLESGKKFSQKEVYTFYRQVVKEIAEIIPQGSISIEVYADNKTSPRNMLSQAKKMFSWAPNAYVKFPTTKKGLVAAQKAVKKGLRINMTLCFSQEQAAAVYSATKGADKGQVYVSPFVGRLDDQGEDGMSLIKNIIQMYTNGDDHVEVLTASVRNFNHFLYALQLGSDIITAPLSILKQWADQGLLLPGDDFTYKSDLKPIEYKDLDLNKDWRTFNISHKLTDIGLERFANDWKALI
ncbi:transaldolase, partial [Patescibacteria group bacterium AH-259-L07]|nr:transaldolase [Patescibacteria group bacterium AH-259-L07]